MCTNNECPVPWTFYRGDENESDSTDTSHNVFVQPPPVTHPSIPNEEEALLKNMDVSNIFYWFFTLNILKFTPIFIYSWMRRGEKTSSWQEKMKTVSKKRIKSRIWRNCLIWKRNSKSVKFLKLKEFKCNNIIQSVLSFYVIIFFLLIYVRYNYS